MSSLPTIVGRACAIGGLGIVVAAAAWSLPAADEPTVDSAGAGTIERVVEAPEVALPDVAEPAGEDAPAPAVDLAPPAPTVPFRERDLEPAAGTPLPDHLVVDPEEAKATTTTTTTTIAPAPTTTRAPAAAVAFSATQKYGSCGEAVPYDIFSGTATPGSTVTVSSPYGSGSATADRDGTWRTKVEFPFAPRNETFDVTVSGLGGSRTLHFTATGEAHA